MDTTALGDAAAPRRRFLRALGLGGAAAAVLPALAGSPRAAGAASTTTAPPRQPTDADVALLAFAQSVEIAAVQAYATVLDRADLELDADQRSLVQVLRQHHLAYAQSISGLLGRAAPNAANAAVVDELGAPFTEGAAGEVLTAAADLENAAVATHLSLLGQLAGVNGSRLVASIIVAEAQHATVLSTLAGGSELVPASGVEALDLALTPEAFPVV